MSFQIHLDLPFLLTHFQQMGLLNGTIKPEKGQNGEKGIKPSTGSIMQAMNENAYQTWDTTALVACKACQRTFRPEALKIHQKSCKTGNVLKYRSTIQPEKLQDDVFGLQEERKIGGHTMMPQKQQQAKAAQPQFQSRLKQKTAFGAAKSTLKQDGHFLTESKVDFQIKDKK